MAEPQRERAIEAPLIERTVVQAAKRARVGERTLHRWLAEDDCRNAYRAASRRILDGTVGRLRAASSGMLDVLIELAHKADSDSVRRAAARDVLELAHKVECDDLAARIERLNAG